MAPPEFQIEVTERRPAKIRLVGSSRRREFPSVARRVGISTETLDATARDAAVASTGEPVTTVESSRRHQPKSLRFVVDALGMAVDRRALLQALSLAPKFITLAEELDDLETQTALADDGGLIIAFDRGDREVTFAVSPDGSSTFFVARDPSVSVHHAGVVTEIQAGSHGLANWLRSTAVELEAPGLVLGDSSRRR